jgi:hypothetical protein
LKNFFATRTTMTDPTPSAQAVLDAANRQSSWGPDDALNDSRWIAAAAIRAVADQVVPVCSTKSDRGMQRMMIRNDFLVIADELEQLND